MDMEVSRSWRDPELLGQGAAQRRAADHLLPRAAGDDLHPHLPAHAELPAALDLGPRHLDGRVLQAALLDDPRPHAVHGGGLRRDLHRDRLSHRLWAGHALQGAATTRSRCSSPSPSSPTPRSRPSAGCCSSTRRAPPTTCSRYLGFPPETVAFLFTDWATLLGMVYNLLPFAIFTIYLSIDNIDRSLILAAYDAGAGKFRAFWEVTLPLSQARHLGGQRADLPAGRRRVPRAQGAGRRQVADVGGTDPPDLRDARQLAAGCRAHAGADGGRRLRRAAVQPRCRHAEGGFAS